VAQDSSVPALSQKNIAPGCLAKVLEVAPDLHF